MSDEPKKPHGKRLNWPIAGILIFVVFVAYFGAHYATAQQIRIVDRTGRLLQAHHMHKIGGRPAPWWVERYFFWPAERLDELFGYDQWPE
jgi:hypothetical protein